MINVDSFARSELPGIFPLFAETRGASRVLPQLQAVETLQIKERVPSHPQQRKGCTRGVQSEAG